MGEGENGIVKMRITGNSAYIEKKWRRDRLGRFLCDCQYLIDKQIKSNPTGSIWDGF